MTALLPHRTSIAWRNAVFVLFMLPGLTMATWVSRLPSVRDSLGIRIDQVGVLILAMAAGSIVGLLLSSHIIARLGAKRTMLIGMIVIASGLVITGLGATFGPVFAVAWMGLFVFGFSSGITDVAMNVSGAANERVLGKALMPIFHAFFSFGTMIGAGIGALAELLRIPIAVHFSGMAVIMVLGMLSVIRLIQSEHIDETGDEAAAEAAGGWRSRLAIWRDPRTVLIGLVVLAAAFAEGSANDWLALAMVDGHGVDNATGALVFGLFVTAMTIGRLGGVVLLNKFGRVPVLRASFLLAFVSLLVMIFVPDPVIASIAAVTWGLGAALGFPIGMSAAADDPRTAAARVSAVATIGYLAFLAGPPLIGLLGEHVGILNALLVVLILCAIGGVIAGAARETTKTPKDASDSDTLVDPAIAP